MRASRNLALAALLFLASSPAFAAGDFPFRAKYPDLPIISLKDLEGEMSKDLIIDTRSKFEYDVIHMNGAHLVPITKMSFPSDLEKVRGKDGAQKLVFYCNGHTCEKSYEAGKAAKTAGFKNFVVFDAGIFEWVSAHPDQTTMFDKTPVDKAKLISHEQLDARSVDYDKVKASAANSASMIIDVREPMQAREKKVELANLHSIPLDRIRAALESRKFQDKTLYFIDAVGKQNEWLQYYLVQYGYKDYYFLKGGAASIH